MNDIVFVEQEIFDQLRPQLEEWNKANGTHISPYLIMAIFEQECQKDKWNPHIYLPGVARLEQNYYRRYVEPKKGRSTATEVLLSASYGLSQMMGDSLLQTRYFQLFKKSRNLSQHHLDPRLIGLAIDHYISSLVDQIDQTLIFFTSKLESAGGNIDLALLRWNGGGDPDYPSKVQSRRARLEERL